MPSLLSIYQSAPKTKKGNEETKGDILVQLQRALRMPYTTARTKVVTNSFSYAEKVVICQTRGAEMEDLFPEPELQNI